MQGALDLGRAREGAGFELVMRGHQIEQLDDARGICGLAAAITGARGMIAIGQVDDGDRDFAGCQAARTEAVDGGRGGVAYEFIEGVGTAEGGFVGGGRE